MSTLLAILAFLAKYLPRAESAALARKLLASLAVVVEGKTTNKILHDGEVVVFADLDAQLARIEAAGD